MPQPANAAGRRASRRKQGSRSSTRCSASPAGDGIDLEIERAVLLAALDRHQDAQQAFVGILRRAPTHFSALNEFGTLLAHMGAIEAACRVYAEAILHHPDNPMARVNLANLLLRANATRKRARIMSARCRPIPIMPRRIRAWAPCWPISATATVAREHFRRAFVAMPSRPCPIAATSRRYRCCNSFPPAAAISRAACSSTTRAS